jgi:hypothetical protein
LNNQIATTSRLSNSLRISCESERRKAENLFNESTRLESIVTEFKGNNEEYLNKIKQAAEENVKTVLTNGKLLLRFATFSVIESLRNNSELCNIILHYISDNNTDRASYGSNSLSLISLGQQQSFSCNDKFYTAFILEEAEKVYSNLTTKLINSVITSACADF